MGQSLTTQLGFQKQCGVSPGVCCAVLQRLTSGTVPPSQCPVPSAHAVKQEDRARDVASVRLRSTHALPGTVLGFFFK